MDDDTKVYYFVKWCIDNNKTPKQAIALITEYWLAELDERKEHNRKDFESAYRAIV